MNREMKSLATYTVTLSDEKVSNAVKSTLEYYVKEACRNKFCFFLTSIISIILNATIPVLYQFEIDKIERIIIIISTISAIATSIAGLFWLKESWLRSRESAERLKSECNKFNGKVGKYNTEEKEREDEFIMVFESIHTANLTQWKESHKEENNNDKENIDNKSTNKERDSVTSSE
jgi:hypothetical protein